MAVERTVPTRVAEDIGEMLSWLSQLRGLRSADVLDPLIREHVASLYEPIRLVVEEIKAAKAKLPATVGA